MALKSGPPQAAHQGLAETSALTAPPKSVRPLPLRASRWPHACPPPTRRRPPSHRTIAIAANSTATIAPPTPPIHPLPLTPPSSSDAATIPRPRHRRRRLGSSQGGEGENGANQRFPKPTHTYGGGRMAVQPAMGASRFSALSVPGTGLTLPCNADVRRIPRKVAETVHRTGIDQPLGQNAREAISALTAK
jgi:hypothetical protein